MFSVFHFGFFFAYFHQTSTIAFTLDFPQTISTFFLDGINLPDIPLGIPVGNRQFIIAMISNPFSTRLAFVSFFSLLIRFHWCLKHDFI
jgi:hypothetical protein